MTRVGPTGLGPATYGLKVRWHRLSPVWLMWVCRVWWGSALLIPRQAVLRHRLDERRRRFVELDRAPLA